MTAWETAAKTNLNKLDKVQNQTLRIITGAVKTIPSKRTGERKTNTTTRRQDRSEKHSVCDRIPNQGKGRLKRTNFIQRAKKLPRRSKSLSQT